MAKKTKRVEKWRAAAAEQQASGTARRGGSSTGRPANRPTGMARGRQASRSPRFPTAWVLGGLAILVVAIGIIVWVNRSGDDETTELAAADLTATAAAAAPPTVAPTGDVFGVVPTQPGVALANDGDVASGCWTEAQRTTDGTQPLQWNAAPAMVIDPAQVYTAELATNYGTMTWQLLPQASESAVNSFVCLARAGYFNGAPFHRIVDQGIFVIQGGDPTGTGTGGPGYTVADTPVVGDYSAGMVSMANTGQPNSSGSQFFINTGDNTASFTPTYLNFARVIAGQETVDAISTVERVDNGRGEISDPVSPVILESVTIYQGGVPAGGAATPVSGTPVGGTPVAAPPPAGTPAAITAPGTPIATPVA